MPSTIDERQFYEAKWATNDLSAGSLRNWLVRKERFFLRQLTNQRGRVLDLGCGGGWRLYAKLGPVIGTDLSHGSLLAAQRIYDGGTVADLVALPFASSSFDFVVSTDVLGHVRFEDKNRVLSEIHRVLRPGGLTLHYVETDGDDPLMRFAKRDPELYQRHIISPEGHIGLETPGAVIERFRSMGFQPVAEVPAYRGLSYVGRMVKYFDNEYARRSLSIGMIVRLCKLLTSVAPLETASNLIMSLLIELGDRLLPATWAGGILVCYRKV